MSPESGIARRLCYAGRQGFKLKTEVERIDPQRLEGRAEIRFTADHLTETRCGVAATFFNEGADLSPPLIFKALYQ